MAGDRHADIERRRRHRRGRRPPPSDLAAVFGSSPLRSASSWISGNGLAAASSRRSLVRICPPVRRSSLFDQLPSAWTTKWPTSAHIDRQVGGALVGRGAIFSRPSAPTPPSGSLARDAPVDDVDHAADRRRSEQQRRRAAQHLDPLGGQRVDRDRMVGAGGGHVEAADAVGQDADAVAAKAAQDRPRRGRAEAGALHAGLARQRLADARAHFPGQVVAVEHRHAAEHVAGPAADAGDDDLVVMVVMRLRRCGGASRGSAGAASLGGLAVERYAEAQQAPRQRNRAT